MEGASFILCAPGECWEDMAGEPPADSSVGMGPGQRALLEKKITEAGGRVVTVLDADSYVLTTESLEVVFASCRFKLALLRRWYCSKPQVGCGATSRWKRGAESPALPYT